jgi:hypothetical protein
MVSNKLKRIYKICNIMNDLNIITIKQLHKKMNTDEYPCCKSSIEKDLFFMKMELDIEYETLHNRGIRFTEKVDLIERIKAWII